MKTILLVGLGGAAGSICRYLTSLVVTRYFQTLFPLGTFAVNIIGCLAVGLLIGGIERMYPTGADLRLFFITGFCGGYTTFSTFAAENVILMQSGHTWTAFLYMGASILLGLLAVCLGLYWAK